MLCASALAILVVVLTVSGIVLVFSYEPGPESSWERDVHRAASAAASWTALGLAVLLVVRWLANRRQTPRLGLPAELGVVGLGVVWLGAFTGYLLPWDQLALYAVTVGTDYRGIDDAAFSDAVRFVFIGSSEVTQSTYRFWTLVHIVVVPAAFLALVVSLAMIRSGREGRRERRP